MPPEDDHTNQPVSLNEVKAHKANNPGLWQPREMLLSILRRLDAGEIAPDHVMVLFAHDTENGNVCGFSQAGTYTPFTQIGMLQHAIQYLVEQ